MARNMTPPAARSLLIGIALLLPALAHAAISDVIVWNGLRAESSLNTTRTSGYSSTTNMRLWWKFNSASNMGADSSGQNHPGTVNGLVTGLTQVDQYGTSRVVATGFNHDGCHVVGNPAFTNGATSDRTYEMWIRNPGKRSSVFFSITDTQAGGGDDIMRMWVNEDGSLEVGDYGPDDGQQTHRTAALTWTTDAWYQIVVVYDYIGGSTGNKHTIKVYRGARSPSIPIALASPLISYTSSSTKVNHWLAVGGHEAGYYKTSSGKGGHLGSDWVGTAPTVTPEQFGATGLNNHDDTDGWRKACERLSVYGKGTLQLTAGRTYMVGRYTVNTSGTKPHYEYAGLGKIIGARGGNVIVEGNGATVKLFDGMYYGGFSPVSGSPNSSITNWKIQDEDRLYAADPGNILQVEDCQNVEVRNITLHGNITQQIWGGTYADAGYQCIQSGLYLKDNDYVSVHDVECYYNGLDGIGILNDNLDATSPKKHIYIDQVWCYYNGRQGLSYNCGNHLEVTNSVFAYTGRIAGKTNLPGAGIDVEPFDRYLAMGTLFANCKFFDNYAPGVLLTGARGVIVRDSIIWGTTTYAAKCDTSSDTDHLFVGCDIYGGYYNNGAKRIKFEDCQFLNPESGYFSANNPNAPVAKRHGIEQDGTASGGTAGSVIVSSCYFEALQGNNLPAGTDFSQVKNKSVHITQGVVQNSIFKHGNWKNSGSYTVATFNNAYLFNNRFGETSIFAAHPTDTYYISDGSSGTQSDIGPLNIIEGTTSLSDHYVTWDVAGGSKTLNNIPTNLSPAEGVLTPNAQSGETQISYTTRPTYTASPAFTNPVDSTGDRLFDEDSPDDWSNAVGLNWVDQTVTVDLKVTRQVRSVKLRMKHLVTQRPKRVVVSTSTSSAGPWTSIGVIQPREVSLTAPWYDVTVPSRVSARYVKLEFENEGEWGWYINEIKVFGTP